jgi:hypothetical protein
MEGKGLNSSNANYKIIIIVVVMLIKLRTGKFPCYKVSLLSRKYLISGPHVDKHCYTF